MGLVDVVPSTHDELQRACARGSAELLHGRLYAPEQLTRRVGTGRAFEREDAERLCAGAIALIRRGGVRYDGDELRDSVGL